ncbi:Ribosome maturation protein SBDS [Taenia crassiceps]|uniref:Ribosome maturation protein SBDS n=1 Tax=Taenia crassiceps TaxID=6207 RepID=A0ABR4QT68_9CEST
MGLHVLECERNIDEVLQAHEIFSNVSKGQLATKSDLFRDFDTENTDAIIPKEIGQTAILRQLRASGNFKIAPAMMEILISLDPKLVDDVSPRILKLVHYIIRQERNPEGIFELSAVIEPENYHSLTIALDEYAKDRYCIEIIGVARPLTGSKKSLPSSSLPPVIASAAPILETSSISEEPSEGCPTPALDDVSKHCTATPANSAGGREDDDRCGMVSKRINQNKKKRRRRSRKIYDDDDVEDDVTDSAAGQKGTDT